MTAVVGLTGGIACGKTTVGCIFRELGVHVVDADQIAREVIAPGTDGFDEVVRAFGVGVVAPDGSLDRRKLAAIVFSDPHKRKELEAITHPRIAARSMQMLAAIAERGDPYAMYEAALLVETGRYRQFAALVVVAASEELQVRRIRARDGLGEDEARARIAAQLPLAEKMRVADYVIWNDGDLATLHTRTERVHEALLQRFDGRARA